MERTVVTHFLYPAFQTPPSNLTFRDQFAFRPTGSTSAAIIQFLHTITSMLANNPYVIVIALDFINAFDTVHHFTMLHNASLTCKIKWNNLNAPKVCKSLPKFLQTFSISILLQPITSAKCRKCIFITYLLHGQTIDHMIFERRQRHYIRIYLCYFCFRSKTVSLVQASLQYLMHHVTVSLQQPKITLQNNCINNTSITQPTLSFYFWLKM